MWALWARRRAGGPKLLLFDFVRFKYLFSLKIVNTRNSYTRVESHESAYTRDPNTAHAGYAYGFTV